MVWFLQQPTFFINIIDFTITQCTPYFRMWQKCSICLSGIHIVCEVIYCIACINTQHMLQISFTYCHGFFLQKLCAIAPHMMGISKKTCGHCKYKLPVLAIMCIAQITAQNICTALQPNKCWYNQYSAVSRINRA